jgi:type II secretion system (T2SS) protein E
MRLGEMLVRDGRLTEAQVADALGYQARDGGRLGTVLFEHGMVDLEALTVYLGLELGIPIATGAMLERAKRAAVRLLQPSQAFKHRCVPLVVQDRQLIAAIEDPHDFAILDALTSITGYRVLPRVAPELRIYYYIERYYGVARPARFLHFGDSPRGNETTIDAGLPAPPLPGLPPVPGAPIAAPGPRPRLRSAMLAKQFDESEALELDAEDLIDTLDADDAAPAEAAPSTTPLAPSAPVTAPRPVALPAPPPLRPDAALRELAAAPDRNRIVDILLGYAAATFDAAVVFTVRDQFAFGWKAIGELPGHASVEHLLIPLGAPSVVQAAVAAETGVFHGPLAPSTINSYLYKVLNCAEPELVTAGAIAIGKRVVNVLYGHAPALTPLELDDFQQVCRVAAGAYARLIAVSKQKR